MTRHIQRYPSVIDDNTALSALRILKQLLHKNDCILMNFKIKFSPNTIEFQNIEIRCKDEQKVLDALEQIETAPGELDLKGQFGRMPNSYSITAVLGDLNKRISDELGLTVRGAAYDNDYVVLTFLPAVRKPEPPPPMPEPLPEMPEMPGEEPLPGEEGEEEGMPGEEMGAEEELEAMPVEETEEEEAPAEEIDWDAMGI